ncbi:type II toxin-antitoxin system prevent-host-death family antitoxin [bacterium]|nr:type II toxin-antitoxin system prevent-host-death family antitoxin [bacterium]RIK76474.1 MAG: prevent-host-death protein [candidate division KSB1 bacterium]
MKQISIANDIIPVGEFKTGLAKWLKSVRDSGRPLVITQNGRPAGVLLSPEAFDQLGHSKSFKESVQRGLVDAEAQRVFDASQLKQELQKRRSSKVAK